MQTTAPCSLHKPLSLAGVWIQIVPSFRTRGMIRGTIITNAAQHNTEQHLLISFLKGLLNRNHTIEQDGEIIAITKQLLSGDGLIH